ncbi:hypothetical protein [Bifidobacterium felsineum]|uniref:hypothetical protein n=1 Tax=Bifidobacterium felsineum TaxID=2045440 RepID=UPI001BDC6D4B|nr:hypothetical protein [Bifidobacterium felsineum]MBT1164838.1 hypothetical protein [Bifidobacterium felsineum]
MEDISMLTTGQAQRLDRIITRLRPHGFDPDGRGVYSPNLHAEPHASGRIDWWMDSDRAFANGSLNTDGEGVWWLRRHYAAELHIRDD